MLNSSNIFHNYEHGLYSQESDSAKSQNNDFDEMIRYTAALQ